MKFTAVIELRSKAQTLTWLSQLCVLLSGGLSGKQNCFPRTIYIKCVSVTRRGGKHSGTCSLLPVGWMLHFHQHAIFQSLEYPFDRSSHFRCLLLWCVALILLGLQLFSGLISWNVSDSWLLTEFSLSSCSGSLAGFMDVVMAWGWLHCFFHNSFVDFPFACLQYWHHHLTRFPLCRSFVRLFQIDLFHSLERTLVFDSRMLLFWTTSISISPEFNDFSAPGGVIIYCMCCDNFVKLGSLWG